MTSRAVANLSTLSEYCLPLVKPYGLFLPYKSGDVEEELKEAKRPIKLLGGELCSVEKYTLPESDLVSESEKSYIQDVRRGIISIEFSGNFGVIKTRPGHANSVGFALDVLALPEILGSVAGDDTIFIILREGMTKEDLLESFNSRIPEVKE